jgi:hypothetical protein
MLMIMLQSHTGDSAAGATWTRRDVDVVSHWRLYCWVMLATTLLGQVGRDAM